MFAPTNAGFVSADTLADSTLNRQGSIEMVIQPVQFRPASFRLRAALAGAAMSATQTPQEEIDLLEMFQRSSGVYVLRVRGDSMIDDHLCDGDYVVIERRKEARDGEQTVVLIDGERSSLRRYYREGANVRLQPANAAMQPETLESSRVKVQGVVIGVLRSYAA